jgi:hypothetical protein
MTHTEKNRRDMNPAAKANIDLPADTHIVYSSDAEVLNDALLHGFLEHQHDPDIKRTHLFGGRYENIYLTSRQIPQLRDLLDEACDHASHFLNIDDLQAGCWFNFMPGGAVTSAHSHDDFDELMSAVYYVSVPENSGNLIIHEGDKRHVISPQEGMFVFFAPDVVHEVSKNMSSDDRLSIAINFGRRRIAED